MKTVTYAQIRDLAARLAGRPPDKLPTSEAELLRDFIEDHLSWLWNQEAWPELCQDFVAVSVANGQFAVSATQGDVLAVYASGNPQTTTICTPLLDWVEQDEVVRVTYPNLPSTLYVEFQDPIPTLPDYGDADLDATTLPYRFRYPLARYAAADLLEDEDPAKAERLRKKAEIEIESQASVLTTPWWRRAKLKG